MAFPIVDLHQHATLKSYGHHFYPNENALDATSEACVWYSDPPTTIDKGIENALGFPPYRQADFKSCVRGGAALVIVSLYPIEKGFVEPKVLAKYAKYTVDWITMFGRKRVEAIQNGSFNYFQDLNDEYHFLTLLDNKVPANTVSKYNILSSGKALSSALATNTLNVIVSIEGAHAFCDGNDTSNPAGWLNLERNIDHVKRWPNPPFFVTFNHHFNNHLASHAESLFVNVLGMQLFDQREAMETPYPQGTFITDLGRRAIDALYSATANTKRTLIDIKHMALGTRKEFYQYRKQKGYESIPLICSHGGVYDLYNHPINLLPEDVLTIRRSEGIIGVELDQRILGYNNNGIKRAWNWLKTVFMSKLKKDRYWARNFWLTIRSIAETCYTENPNKNPWKIISLGSDLDGIINPINDFRTAKDLQNLSIALLGWVQEYFDDGGMIPNGHLGMDAHDVVYQIMYANAVEFITANYGA